MLELTLWFRFYKNASTFYNNHEVLSQMLIVSFIVVIGSLIEGATTSLEVHWDNIRESTLQVKENWYKYLSSVLENEPVGYRYLSSRVDFLYFELNMMVASVSFFLGCAYLLHRTLGTDNFFAQLSLVALSVLSWRYLRYEAKKTHLVLCTVRKEINKEIERKKAKIESKGNEQALFNINVSQKNA